MLDRERDGANALHDELPGALPLRAVGQQREPLLECRVPGRDSLHLRPGWHSDEPKRQPG